MLVMFMWSMRMLGYDAIVKWGWGLKEDETKTEISRRGGEECQALT